MGDCRRKTLYKHDAIRPQKMEPGYIHANVLSSSVHPVQLSHSESWPKPIVLFFLAMLREAWHKLLPLGFFLVAFEASDTCTNFLWTALLVLAHQYYPLLANPSEHHSSEHAVHRLDRQTSHTNVHDFTNWGAPPILSSTLAPRTVKMQA